MKKLITTICVITSISLLMGGTTALAQDTNGTFTVYPSYMHDGNSQWLLLNAAPGKQLKDYVTIENLTSQEQTVSLQARTANQTEKGFIINENQTENDFTTWIKFEKTDYTLNPLQKIKVPFEINVPASAEIKEYSGAILGSQSVKNENGLNIVTRIGTRLYLNVVEPAATGSTNIGSANIFSAQSIYFFLSLFALIGGSFYITINYLDQKKHENKNA